MNCAVILSGHDTACCRSHSIRNMLLLLKLPQMAIGTRVDIYIHPSEYSFLYKLIVREKFQGLKFKIFGRCKSLEPYDTIFAAMSSVLSAVKPSQNLYIYDPAIPKEYLAKNFPSAILTW